ncbi:MAG: CAP domain-containing protein [Dehalococcoidia bacterium]|nr:CAP domain-containing protein [Dehalococcoidia bacterium]
MRRFATLIAGAALFAVAAAMPLFSASSPAVALTNCDVADYSNDAEELEFLRIINEYRAANGRAALGISQNLNRAAQWMAADMGSKGYFGHVDSLGRDPWVRIVDCGYPLAGGENLAAGTYRSTAAGAFELFRGSPSHNENMLLDRYVQIGIARVFAPNSQYGWYWATTFGTTDDGTNPYAAAPTPVAEPVSNGGTQARVPTSVFSLQPGANFVLWTGEDTDPSQLVAGASSVRMLYFWDQAEQSWKRYGPGLPWFVQSLDEVHTGDGLWVVASSSGRLQSLRRPTPRREPLD